MLLAYVIGLGGPKVTLSGGGASDTVVDPQDATAILRFTDDGIVENQDSTQQSADTDWIRPVSSAPGTYQIRFTNATGDTIGSSTAAEDSWHAFSSGDFSMTNNQTTPGSRSTTFTIQIRNGTGPVIASAEYTVTATVTI